jgi:hypothetical protein
LYPYNDNNLNSPASRNSINYQGYNYNQYSNDDERFFLAPFVVGGLAGTALGYGIANNNQINNNQMGGYYPVYPIYQAYPIYPTYSSTNYFY